MKKFMFMLVAALMATTSMFAQDGYDTKHEVSVSYGYYGTSQFIDDFGSSLGNAIMGNETSDEKFVGPISAEYFYHVSPLIGVGGIFVYSQVSQDELSSGKVVGTSTDKYYTLMPAVKFNWLRKKHFGLYSKIGAGATYYDWGYEDKSGTSNNTSDDDDTGFNFNWQLSFIGAEFGGETLRGFVELAFGEQGVVLGGIRCKF